MKAGLNRGGVHNFDAASARSRWRCIGAVPFGLLLITLFLTLSAMPIGHAVEVVVNRSVQEVAIKRPTAWAIFSMRLRTWSNGAPTSVFVLSDNTPLHAEFTKKILDTFPYQLRRAWDRLVFSGTGQAPTEVNSIEEMYERISSTPGAIGYLPADRIDRNVRSLKVE